MTDTADEVRFDPCAGEEFLVDGVVVEARHRAAIQTERARCENEITALQRAVAKRRRVLKSRLLEPILGILIMGEEFRHPFGEIEIVADDRRCGCGQNLGNVSWCAMRRQSFLRSLRDCEDEAGGRELALVGPMRMRS